MLTLIGMLTLTVMLLYCCGDSVHASVRLTSLTGTDIHAANISSELEYYNAPKGKNAVIVWRFRLKPRKPAKWVRSMFIAGTTTEPFAEEKF
ncbi:hypothetical protein ACMFMF_008249 [Clarireedia jacksonii]